MGASEAGARAGLTATVKVVDAETEEPIAGASVRLDPVRDTSPAKVAGLELPGSFGVTDARGIFEANGEVHQQ